MLLHHSSKSLRGLECTLSHVWQNLSILVSFTPNLSSFGQSAPYCYSVRQCDPSPCLTVVCLSSLSVKFFKFLT